MLLILALKPLIYNCKSLHNHLFRVLPLQLLERLAAAFVRVLGHLVGLAALNRGLWQVEGSARDRSAEVIFVG